MLSTVGSKETVDGRETLEVSISVRTASRSYSTDCREIRIEECQGV